VDANGTRFHLLLGKNDWLSRPGACGAAASTSPVSAGGLPAGITWNDERREIMLTPLPFEFSPAPSDRAPTLDDRRGAARDRFGNWYWIDISTATILVRSVGSRVTSLFWKASESATCVREAGRGAFAPVSAAPAATPLGLRGLAVTDDHYLVAGVVEPAGVLVFDLHAGGPPLQYCWPPPADVLFAPFDLAPRAGGGVWILDRDHARVWVVDEHFDVVRRLPATAPPAEFFQPVNGTRHDAAPGGFATIQPGDAWPVPAHLIAIEALPGGALLLMDRPPAASFSTIYYYATIDTAPVALPLARWTLLGHDLAFAPPDTAGPAAHLGRVYVVAPDGNQSVAFTLARDQTGTLTLDRLPQYLPMRLFEGKGLVAAGGQVYYDFDRAWIPLVDQKRPRHMQEGTLRVDALDGYDPDCVWHRLLLDASIPPETSLDIWSRAANSCDQLASTNWHREPAPYRRGSGSELPWVPSGSGDGVGTWELLFQHAVGRYLDLRLELRGNGRATPRLRAMRVYYPRFSYLTRYLPGVYREEPASASFLDRFLANLEGLLTPIEDRVAAAQVLFDIRSAPPDTLDWLASWLGLVLDPLWSDDKRRALIAHAMVFYQYRGTMRGLQMALALSLFDCTPAELFTDTASRRSPASRIRLVERFRTREAPGVVFGDPTELEGPRLVARESLWNPKAGRSILHQRFRDFLVANGIVVPVNEEFSLTRPADASRAALWVRFSQETLGFIPAIAAVAPASWQQFLARRYHGVASFNEVYGRTGHGAIRTFDVVPVPTAVPPDGGPLVDWYDYETIVVSMEAAAHQFTVLLPVQASAQADSAEHRRQLEIATRIVALEKPAHTTFEVRFFWSLFRVGEVRLGYDTVIGLGSRSPDLLTAMVLDSGHLAASYLAPSHPQDVPDREVLGRDRVGGPPC
jgi:phage tail-like protein